MDRPLRILLIGPTSAPWDEISAGVGDDLARLARPGVELTYLHLAKGPASITTAADAAAAEPHVIEATREAARDGFDAAIVDCTADPGVATSREQAGIPVIGPGEALHEAIERAPAPVVVLSGDQLRSGTQEDLVTLVADAGARTVALGGTGWSHLGDRFAERGLVVLDPLAVALERCLAQLRAVSPAD